MVTGKVLTTDRCLRRINGIPKLCDLELHSGVVAPCQDSPFSRIEKIGCAPIVNSAIQFVSECGCELTLLRLCTNALSFPSRPLLASYKPPRAQLCAQAPIRGAYQHRPMSIPSTFYSPFGLMFLISLAGTHPRWLIFFSPHLPFSFLISGLRRTYYRSSNRLTYMRCPREGTMMDTFYLSVD